MLERKDKLMIGARWVLVLGVLTHDSYLLLFDVPKGCTAYKKNLDARTSEVRRGKMAGFEKGCRLR